MDVQAAYDRWAGHYDRDPNRTRDLEASALRQLLAPLHAPRVLELGCGTGKNTGWLAERATHVTAVDFSAGMLAEARAKVAASHVVFQVADLAQPWPRFSDEGFDLAVFSLVLEHLPHLAPVLGQAAAALRPGGWLYAGELHPFKQYMGSQARFNTPAGEERIPAYRHHVSDYVAAGQSAGLALHDLREYFDAAPQAPPRLLCLLWRKPLVEHVD